jgi:glycosyltransferase involved in cell wall biosynthesis
MRLAMAKVDMHCHSKFSKRPSEWFLQRLGAAESYTEPDFIYQTMKSRGMDFVTVTDHNNMEASFELTQKYPQDAFTGTESTVYFPEDGCKIHVLVYGQTPEQFKIIQKVRKDIYEFRDYIKEQNLAYSVAHATFSVNGRIQLHHLEKLMLLFDVFEGINGGRGKLHNTTWVRTLENLSPLAIENLYSKYRIEPISDNPWIKGFTGGSDDHAGLFLGKTYTLTRADSVDEYLERIKKKECRHAGRYSDFHSLAFTVYKIAHDFSQTKKSVHFAGGLFSKITGYIFEQEKPGFIERVKMKGFRVKSSSKGAGKINHMLMDLVNEMRNESFDNIENKLNLVYHKASDIADEYFRMMVSYLAKDIDKISMDDLYRSISTALPGMFLSIPFFSSFNQIYKDRELINELDDKFNYKEKPRKKRILWFTDTINDLNGVSVTLRTIGKLCDEKGYDLKLVSSLTPDELDHRLPPNLMNLEPITHFNLPYYEKLKVKIPSVIRALEDIYEFEPDEVYISTPGPVGLVGLLASRLLSVKSIGIYHTDFTGEVHEIAKNDSLTNLVEAYTRWFFDSVTELKTTSRQYIDYLEGRGISRSKMSVFKRGIDADLFRPVEKNKDSVMTLCYAGRVSKDKNLKFLFNLFDDLEQKYNLRLIIAGHGPYSEEVEKHAKGRENIIVKGEVDHVRMPEVYADADLFVFPSNTDTFGMVVLESQACGLPGVVSDMGGPKEIVAEGETGLVAKASDYSDWTDKLEHMIELYYEDREAFDAYGVNARKRVLEVYNWDAVLEELFTRKKSSWRMSPPKLEFPETIVKTA